MTLKQYEKQLEEKRKALDSLKTEERKVTVDEEFNSMLVIGKKNGEEANFIQLVSFQSFFLLCSSFDLNKLSPFIDLLHIFMC